MSGPWRDSLWRSVGQPVLDNRRTVPLSWWYSELYVARKPDGRPREKILSLPLSFQGTALNLGTWIHWELVHWKGVGGQARMWLFWTCCKVCLPNPATQSSPEPATRICERLMIGAPAGPTGDRHNPNSYCRACGELFFLHGCAGIPDLPCENMDIEWGPHEFGTPACFG